MFDYTFSESAAQMSLQNYDRGVRLRNMLMAFLGVFGIVSAITLMESTWDHNLAQDRPSSRWEFFLKLTISASTLLLLLLVAEYYHFQSRHERKVWHIPDSNLWLKHRNWFLALEIFILALHPPPTEIFTEIGSERHYPNSVCVLMGLRLYLVFRVIRDWCPVYRERRMLMTVPSIRSMGNLRFNWLSAIRYFFLHWMWLVTFIASITAFFAMMYIVYVLERRVTPDFTLAIAAWYTVSTMTTVGFGDQIASHPSSQAASAMAALLGILLASIYIFIVVQTLEYNAIEREAHNRMLLDRVRTKQETAAATLIQVHWRWHMYRRKVLATDDTEQQNEMYAMFRMTNGELKHKLKKYRRLQTTTLAPRHPGLNARFSFVDRILTEAVEDINALRRDVRSGNRNSSRSLKQLRREVDEVNGRVANMEGASSAAPQPPALRSRGADGDLGKRLRKIEKAIMYVARTGKRTQADIDSLRRKAGRSPRPAASPARSGPSAKIERRLRADLENEYHEAMLHVDEAQQNFLQRLEAAHASAVRKVTASGVGGQNTHDLQVQLDSIHNMLRHELNTGMIELRELTTEAHGSVLSGVRGELHRRTSAHSRRRFSSSDTDAASSTDDGNESSNDDDASTASSSVSSSSA